MSRRTEQGRQRRWRMHCDDDVPARETATSGLAGNRFSRTYLSLLFMHNKDAADTNAPNRNFRGLFCRCSTFTCSFEDRAILHFCRHSASGESSLKHSRGCVLLFSIDQSHASIRRQSSFESLRRMGLAVRRLWRSCALSWRSHRARRALASSSHSASGPTGPGGGIVYVDHVCFNN